jgi:hypothetical protein
MPSHTVQSPTWQLYAIFENTKLEFSGSNRQEFFVPKKIGSSFQNENLFFVSSYDQEPRARYRIGSSLWIIAFSKDPAVQYN